MTHHSLHVLLLLAAALMASGQPANQGNGPDLKTISLNLKLRTGGEVTGALLDHDANALVVLSGTTPYVFAWIELDPGSALFARRKIMELGKKPGEQFSAAEYFELGKFALDMGRNDLASIEFEEARKKDRSYAPRVKAAFDQFRKESESWKRDPAADLPAIDVDRTADDAPLPDKPVESATFEALPEPSASVREDVRAAYLKYGEKVRDVLGRDIKLVETDHFLIWTDWGPKEQARLVVWCETMYQTLAKQFGLAGDGDDADVFLAKCPVFCFRSKARFRRFAREFDGYDAQNAIGYTRSIEKNGHVHMAFARMGSTPQDYDRFACTLVHEGTHAFLHRVHSTRLLPHWVNEGYAELTAERVLGDRCPAGENAALLARQYARFDWPVAAFLERTSTIEVHEYPLAHSIVSYLEFLGTDRLVKLIATLKSGTDLPSAMAQSFDGMTIPQLESRWKESNKPAPPSPGAAGTEIRD